MSPASRASIVGLPKTGAGTAAILFGDQVRVAYAFDGLLTMSVGADHGRAVRRLQPVAARVAAERSESGLQVRIPLRDVTVQRAGVAPTVVGVAPVPSAPSAVPPTVHQLSQRCAS